MSTPGANSTPAPTRKVFRFGVFELDSRVGELRKHGLRLRIQGKPLQVLQALVESPGQVVTREELQRRLWPSDVFVDFDSGLNTAANRLRLALGDSADSPRTSKPSLVRATASSRPLKWSRRRCRSSGRLRARGELPSRS